MQVLGQNDGLRTARNIILHEQSLLKRRGTPVVTAPPARTDLNPLRALKILWLWPVSGIDPDQPVPVLPKCIMRRKTRIVLIPT